MSCCLFQPLEAKHFVYSCLLSRDKQQPYEEYYSLDDYVNKQIIIILINTWNCGTFAVPLPSCAAAEREILAWLYPSSGAWLTWAKRERNAEIVLRRAGGKTLAALAKEFGVTEQRVWRIIQGYS